MGRDELAAFAAELRKAMATAGVTNAAMAKAIGVTPQQVSAWRHGHHQPSAQHITAMERELGLARGELFQHLSTEPEAVASSGDPGEVNLADIMRELQELRARVEEIDRRDRE